MPAVRSNDDLRPNLLASPQDDARDAVFLPEDIAHDRTRHELDGLPATCAVEEDLVERLAPNRQAVALLARILRGTFDRNGIAFHVRPLPGERRTSKGENARQYAQAIKHINHAAPTKEMSRARGTGKVIPVEQQHGDVEVTEQRSERRSHHPSPDYNDIVFAPHHYQQSLTRRPLLQPMARPDTGQGSRADTCFLPSNRQGLRSVTPGLTTQEAYLVRRKQPTA